MDETRTASACHRRPVTAITARSTVPCSCTAAQLEARLLDLALASPLLRLDSVAYLPGGRAFEYSLTLQRGDRARVDLEFLPAPDEL